MRGRGKRERAARAWWWTIGLVAAEIVLVALLVWVLFGRERDSGNLNAWNGSALVEPRDQAPIGGLESS